MSIIETIIDIPAEHERKVCGQFDSYLKKIERTLHVSMVARDGEIKVIGPDHAVKRAKSVFSTLLELSKRGEEIGEQNVDYALALSFEDKDTEMLSLDCDIICHTINGKPVKPKTLGQKQYIDLIRKKMIVFGVGTCGNRKKRILACPMAIQAFKKWGSGQDHPDTSGHRGGREIRLPSGRPSEQDRSVPAPTLRRPLPDHGRGQLSSQFRERPDRGGASRLHARTYLR